MKNRTKLRSVFVLVVAAFIGAAIVTAPAAARVGNPIGTKKKQHIPLICAAFNGLRVVVVIKGPNGGGCRVTSTLSNCEAAVGGGCNCIATVSERDGDCGD